VQIRCEFSRENGREISRRQFACTAGFASQVHQRPPRHELLEGQPPEVTRAGAAAPKATAAIGGVAGAAASPAIPFSTASSSAAALARATGGALTVRTPMNQPTVRSENRHRPKKSQTDTDSGLEQEAKKSLKPKTSGSRVRFRAIAGTMGMVREI
jgi:hypothetical protein